MHRIFRTINFKLVSIYAGIFSVSVLILGIIIFYTIRTSVEQHIREQIELDASQLMGDYRDDGIDELRHDIRERIETNPANRLLYFIQSPNGRVIFDKIEQIPPSGWHKLTTADGRRVLLYSVDLEDGYRFGLASDMERALDLQTTIRNAFFVALVFSLLLGILGGLLVSRRFLARLDAFNRISEEIGRQGALSKRLPIDGSGDDFDQLAQIVNNLLERIEKLVGEIRQVSTNIAHDLRTPFGRIRQKLEDLQKKMEREADIKIRLDETITILDETLETFSALLRIAEIESGVQRKNFSQVSLPEVLDSLKCAYAPVAEDHGLTLTFSCASNILIEGDKGLLAQLFANLIENAISHSGANAKKIHVELWHTNHTVEVTVSDDGQGVPVAEKDNILKPFYRLGSSRNKTGAGLD